MKKQQRTREESEGERESFRTFVKAVPLLTLEEFDGPKLSRPQHPQRYASKMPWRVKSCWRLVQAFQSLLLESETCRLWWEGRGPISTLVLWHFRKRERVVTALWSLHCCHMSLLYQPSFKNSEYLCCASCPYLELKITSGPRSHRTCVELRHHYALTDERNWL